MTQVRNRRLLAVLGLFLIFGSAYLYVHDRNLRDARAAKFEHQFHTASVELGARTAELQELRKEFEARSQERSHDVKELDSLRAQLKVQKHLHVPSLPANYHDTPQIAAPPTNAYHCSLANSNWWWRDIAHAAAEVAVDGMVVFNSYVQVGASTDIHRNGFTGLDMVRNWARHVEVHLHMTPLLICAPADCNLLKSVGVRARFVPDSVKRQVTHVKWHVAITLVQLGYTAFFLDIDLGFFQNPFVGPNRIKTIGHNPIESIPDVQVISDFFDGSAGEDAFSQEEYMRRIQYWNATNYNQDTLRSDIGRPPSCTWFNTYSCGAFPTYCVGASVWIIQPTVASARYLTEILINQQSNPDLHEQQNMNILLDYHLKLGLTVELLPGYLYANAPNLQTHALYTGKTFQEFGAVMMHCGYSGDKQWELYRTGLWLLDCGFYVDKRTVDKPCKY
eukprot:TRINITY_DN7976_c0_g1_i1.p1 TRINITY_DN7976_c0_g1~~TRINITY_DN7976_c0_g1_i1.p1  ORF type:complete len:448 (-),score=47.13 TRINITY_DN7976_c0_g1_i1:516-1859(-)